MFVVFIKVQSQWLNTSAPNLIFNISTWTSVNVYTSPTLLQECLFIVFLSFKFCDTSFTFLFCLWSFCFVNSMYMFTLCQTCSPDVETYEWSHSTCLILTLDPNAYGRAYNEAIISFLRFLHYLWERYALNTVGGNRCYF